jgi:CMP-N,N'-diacetyllegionaminic acid synthase
MDVPFLGVIPARRGSKGIPRKNLEPLGGKPLLQWTVEAALGATRLDRLLLTSDDPEAIELAEGLGCAAPFVRPAELAADHVPTVDVVLHALDWVETRGDRVDSVVVLHPTSPFRDAADVDAAIVEFQGSGRSTLLAAVPVSQHPAECYRLVDGRLAPAIDWPDGATGRQSLPAFFYDTGAIFVTSVEHLRTSRTLHDEHSALYLLEPSHGLEIDEPYQLELARSWVDAGPLQQSTA